MTTDELWMKIDAKFTNLDDKLDKVATTVQLHEQTLMQIRAEAEAVEKRHDKEIAAIKSDAREEHDKMQNRITKLERWMWFSLGAGGAAGAGIVKLLGG